ncbi:MAG: hypothetical protein DRP74_00650 [Candidatus Omnitrophota bacterium]|nr:MAG: hypothetical protein DRP74_00650 [Candidatus Omnitrophota bacterium]
MRDPRAYKDPKYDNRKGYGLYYWHDGYIEIAKQLIRRFKIFKFLELGCAKGFLVQAMRMIGVEAYGVDISEYAVANCHPEMKKYIMQGDATELGIFEDCYFDLVFSWDFLEHLKSEEILRCLIECRRVSDKYIYHGITVFDKNYGSIAKHFPNEPQDPTHVSCYNINWWRKIFREVFADKEIIEFKLQDNAFASGNKRRAQLEAVICIK